MKYLLLAGLWLTLLACTSSDQKQQDVASETDKIRLIIDTDANNELDDQHALAYALFNRHVFDIEGITVNNTRNGGDIQGHYDEAVRVLQLCGAYDDVTIYKGAQGRFADIESHLDEGTYDGQEAVEFIIQQARANDARPLVLLPIGKLTNIALALKKAPDIADKVRIVWLGSNYPDPGEYNLDDDTTSVNPVVQSAAPFEMAVVRYGKPSGTAAVWVTPADVDAHIKGKGVKVPSPVTGRHGNAFTTFGDYAVDLFAHIDLHGNPPSRALFDMAAVAIVKNPAWADRTEVPAPTLTGNRWVLPTNNPKKIVIWENFKKDEILNDFYQSLEKPQSGR